MGLPSYFQRVMCTEVLAELHAVVCCLYLDDLIVTGRTEEEFLTNMGEFFSTTMGKRYHLQHAEVEYVRRTLNSSGLHFKRSKLDSILEWEKANTQKQLKRFLGVVNWFRDHVKNHSIIVKPLNQLIRNFSKSLQITIAKNGLRRLLQLSKKLNGQCMSARYSISWMTHLPYFWRQTHHNMESVSAY